MGYHSLMGIIIYMHNFLKVWDKNKFFLQASGLSCTAPGVEALLYGAHCAGREKTSSQDPNNYELHKIKDTWVVTPGFGKIGRYSGFASVFKMEMDWGNSDAQVLPSR